MASGNLRICFVTLFPEIVQAFVNSSILLRATRNKLVGFETVNPRDFTFDRNHKVDDSPYGGEPGMLIKAEPVALAIESLKLDSSARIIDLDPRGKIFEQSDSLELARCTEICFLCGHYEGIDHRVIELFASDCYSIGNFVVTGGEVPAMLIADSIVRQIPGTLGNPLSLNADSFSEANEGRLSAPNYTRPEVWRGVRVPEVLLSGNHEKIKSWRKSQSEEISLKRSIPLPSQTPDKEPGS